MELREKTLLDNLAFDNNLIVVFSNKAYLNVLKNWFLFAKDCHIENSIVIALDSGIKKDLVEAGIPYLYRPLKKDKIKTLWSHRINIISELLTEGYNVIHSDADAILLKNPFKYFNSLPSIDLFFSQGTVWPKSIHNKWNFVLCFGFFYARSNWRVITLFKFLKILVKFFNDDQVAINHSLLTLRTKWKINNPYLLQYRDDFFNCSKSNIFGQTIFNLFKICVLPHAQFQRICQVETNKNVYMKHPLSEKNCSDSLKMLESFGLRKN